MRTVVKLGLGGRKVEGVGQLPHGQTGYLESPLESRQSNCKFSMVSPSMIVFPFSKRSFFFSPYTRSFSVPKWEAGLPQRHGAKIACHAVETRDAEQRSEDGMYGATKVQWLRVVASS